MNIKGAIHYYKKTRGIKITQQEIAAKIYPYMTKSGRDIRISKLSTGKDIGVTPTEINQYCELLGVDANFLLQIEPMKCNETPATKKTNF